MTHEQFVQKELPRIDTLLSKLPDSLQQLSLIELEIFKSSVTMKAYNVADVCAKLLVGQLLQPSPTTRLVNVLDVVLERCCVAMEASISFSHHAKLLYACLIVVASVLHLRSLAAGSRKQKHTAKVFMRSLQDEDVVALTRCGAVDSCVQLRHLVKFICLQLSVFLRHDHYTSAVYLAFGKGAYIGYSAIVPVSYTHLTLPTKRIV